MNLFKQNGYHWVNFVDAQGARRRKPTGVRIGDGSEMAEAHEKAGKVVTQFNLSLVDGGQPVKVSIVRPNLGQAMERYYDKYWKHQKQAPAIQWTVAILSREIGHWPITDIDFKRLEAYMERLRDIDGNANATITKKMQAIRQVLGHCVDLGELEKVPKFPKKLKGAQRERYMSPEEEAKVFDFLRRKAFLDSHAPAPDGGWEYTFHLATFLLDTGFRFSEAFRFFINEGRACLPRGATKNDKPRQVPMTPRAATSAAWLLDSAVYQDHKARLTEVLEERPTNPKRIAYVTKGVWDYVAHRWNSATKHHKVRDITLHILRHTCASRMVQRRISLYVVQQWLGHETINVTARYAHLAPGNFDDALAVLATFAPAGNVVPFTAPPSVPPVGETTTCHATTPQWEAPGGQMSRKGA